MILARYLRLSDEDRDLEIQGKIESNSIENQRMIVDDYIQTHPDLKAYELVEYCDDGYSGTNFERPGFQEMMRQVKRKKIAGIIVKDLSRFGRDHLDVGSYLELILPIFDVRFISVNDFFDSNDYIGTTGGMELAFRNLINGLYSKDLSIKIKSAKRTRERQGQYLGGNPLYGYLRDPKDKHHLIVDRETRDVVERIFTHTVKGKTTREIARALNEEQVLCPSELKRSRGIRYGRETKEEQAIWTQSAIKTILRDERYMGHMVSYKRRCAHIGTNRMANNDRSQWITVKNTHDAIISEELFEQANAALLARKKVANKNTSWKNSGNLFVCGCCGRKLQKSKGQEPYLYCLKSQLMPETPCAQISLSKAEESVILILRIMGQTLTNGAVVKRKKKNLDLQEAKRELDNGRRRLEKLKSKRTLQYEAYRDGKLSKEDFLKAQESLSQKREALEHLIAEREQWLKEQEKIQQQIEQAQDELRTVSELQTYDSAIVGQIVEKIIVHAGGRLELIMRSQDAYKQIFDKNPEIII